MTGESSRLDGLTSWHADWRGLRVAVFGLSVTGFSVADTLAELGAEVLVLAESADPAYERLLPVIGVRSSMGSLSTPPAELVALVLACCVRRNNREHERTGSWDFSDDEEMRRRPLIDSPSPSQRSTPLSPSPYGTPMGSTPARAGPSATPVSSSAAADEMWSQRMREMYGLDTTQYSYVPRDEAPGRAEEGGHTDGGRGAARAGCAVM